MRILALMIAGMLGASCIGTSNAKTKAPADASTDGSAKPGDSAVSTWPPLRLGVWETTSEVTPPSGKVKRGKGSMNVCHHPKSMFFGYWGIKEVGRGGCQWHSVKVSESVYSITPSAAIVPGLLLVMVTVTVPSRVASWTSSRSCHGRPPSAAPEQGRRLPGVFLVLRFVAPQEGLPRRDSADTGRKTIRGSTVRDRNSPNPNVNRNPE